MKLTELRREIFFKQPGAFEAPFITIDSRGHGCEENTYCRSL